MNIIDISILKEEPLRDIKSKLIIEPLAPLSMVSELPGSYYKSRKTPSKKMICGLIENVLGWHFSSSIRKSIIEQIKQYRNNVNDYEVGSTYKPLLMDYFEIEEPPFVKFDSICFYDDLWARNHSRKDSPSEHYKRCRHTNPLIITEWNDYLDDIENNQELSNEEKKEKKKQINKKYIAKFPFFYPVLPSKREYVYMENGSYTYNATFDSKLYSVLRESLVHNNIAYLGNSEGWVNIKLEKE